MYKLNYWFKNLFKKGHKQTSENNDKPITMTTVNGITIINGKTYRGTNIKVKNNKIYVNGRYKGDL